MTTNTDPVRAQPTSELIDAVAFAIPGSVPTTAKAREIAERVIEIVRGSLASEPTRAPVGVECDPAAIGAAFLAVLGDPAVSWRTMPDVDRFTSRVAEAAALAQQPAGVDRDEVHRVAQHIGAAADYIDTAYPDANMLDRGPILRNMRRWHARLTAALAAQQQGGA